MQRWIRFFSVLAAAALIAFVVWNYNDLRLHKEISPREVAKVELKAKGSQTPVTATDKEAEQIIQWYNAAGNIRDNSHHGAPGCGDFNHIYITLTSGERIAISSYDRVTRYRTTSDPDYIDYYFHQAELAQFLDTLHLRLKSTASAGC